MQSMFDGCSSLISLDINNFRTPNVQYMNKMFNNCISLKSLYFRYLTTESLGTMYRMFYNCKNLTYLDLYSLTESGQSIVQMFEKSSKSFKLCIKDNKYIPNIFNEILKTSFQRDCSRDCYINNEVVHYIPSKKLCCAKYVYNNECYDICPKRTKDINGDKICEDLNCQYIYDYYNGYYYDYYYNYEQNDCINYLPTGYFINDTTLKTIDKCHSNCKTCKGKPTNITMNCLICQDDVPYIYLGNCYRNCLFGEFYENGIKICKCVNQRCLTCTDNSIEFGLCTRCNYGYYKKEDDNRYSFNCYNETDELEEYYLDKPNQIYRHCYHSCKYCEYGGDKTEHHCLKCNADNSYSIPMEENNTLMNCYPDCDYYYYFDNNGDYKCRTGPGCPRFLKDNTRECVESCKEKYKYQFQKKCFFECPIDSIDIQNSTGFYCKAHCPIERPFEMIETEICVLCCTIMDRYNKKCITNYEGEDSYLIDDIIMSCIEEDIVDTFDYNFITHNQSLILDEYPYIYEITSTTCTYVNPNLGKINLKKCEDRLKEYYGIPENDTLYILKIDAYVGGKMGPKIEYEVYYPFNGIRLHQLDISICEGIQISVGVPINDTIDNIDKYDRNSGFYNDICYTYTNEKGTDVTLEDRLDEFNKYNRSICDEGCRLVGVDSGNVHAECSCEIKFNIPFASQINVDKNKLYKYINIKNIANFKVMKCYKLVFSAKGIKENIGFYCLLLTVVVYFICLFYFYLKEYKLIKLMINEIVFAKKNERYLNKIYKFRENSKKNIFENFIEKKKLEHEFNVGKIIHNKSKSSIDIKNKKQEDKIFTDNSNKNLNFLNEKEDKSKKETTNPETLKKNEVEETKIQDENSTKVLAEINKVKNAPPKKSLFEPSQKDYKQNLNVKKFSSFKKSNKKIVFSKKKLIHVINDKYYEKFNEKQKSKIRFILSYTDNELNDLSYKKALKFEKRTYFQYYLSLIKSNHTFFKIFNKRDYNAISIKVLLFFFDFASNYAVNALFFNDDTMHQIYDDGGDFNFIYQLPQIIYSTIISILIDSIISYLGLSEDDILSVKHVKDIKNIDRRAKEVLSLLHIKFIAFFIVNFLFLILYWYYLGCFCAVYTNTQIHLITDTLIGFGTSFISPFGKSFVPGIFRIPSLKKNSKGNKIVYKLSKFLQKI